MLKYFMLPFVLLPLASVQSEEPHPQKQTIVARIEPDYTITFAELQKFVLDYQYNYRYRKNPGKAYSVALEDMIVNQLKIIDFFSLGLQEKEGLLQGIRRSINEELVIEYYNTQFYGKYVNEDSMQNAYKEMGKEVVYQQIVLAKPKQYSRQSIDSLKSAAKDIETKIRNGTDFAELVKRYSQDVQSSRRDGSMPPLDWRMSLTSTLNYFVFHLPINEVRVAESRTSLHIVKVARINKVDVPPYENVKEEIRNILRERYAEFSLREFERTKKNLVDEHTVQWNPKALLQLVRWSNIPRFYQTSYSDTLRYAISHGRNFLILKYSRGKVDLKEYLRLLNDVLIWGNYTSIKEDDVKKFILEAVRTDGIVRKARRLNLEKEIFGPRTTDPVLRNEIIRLYNREIIEAQIPERTEKALKDYYQANKDSLYYQLAKVNIYAVVDSNKNAMNKLKDKLNQNIPFEKIVPEILVKTYVRRRDGTFDTFLQDEPPFLAESAFKLKLNEVAGPIEYVDPAKGKQYALIKCVGMREEKQLSYDDVNKTIADDFANYHRERIAQSVREHLKKKYTATIYGDALRQNLSSIGISLQ